MRKRIEVFSSEAEATNQKHVLVADGWRVEGPTRWEVIAWNASAMGGALDPATNAWALESTRD